jgi:hypothetical protein
MDKTPGSLLSDSCATERDKAIDHYSRWGSVRALTPEEVIKVIAQVLEQNIPHRNAQELGVIYIYTELCAYPERYGFESENQLPLMPDFTAICVGRFPSRREVNKVFIRPTKCLWQK